MINQILFISEQKLKSFTSVHQSVSPVDLHPYVLQSQDLYLQNYLGAKLYHELQTQILASTVSPNNVILLDDHIGPMLCNWALYQALPFLKYKIFNKSVMSNDSQSGQSIQLDELKFLLSEVRNVAESYTKKMVNYLEVNSTLYPSYTSNTATDGNNPDHSNPYFSGVTTSLSTRRGCNPKDYPYES